MKQTTLSVIAGTMLLCALPALAKVTAAEAAKLGAELTPLGAIQAGNTEGTIPAWEGGITNAPAGYKPGTHHVDPFADDTPLFTIRAANADEHKDKLTTGHLAMLKAYPSFAMPVYPTRRSASLPQALYDATRRNATQATLINNGNGIANAEPGIAFPFPANGTEAIWNHLFRYRGDQLQRVIGQATPDAGGNFTLVEIDEQIIWDYNRNKDNLLGRYLQIVKKPARLSGEILLILETLDQEKQKRRPYKYNPGLRKTIAAPNVAHDAPGTASDNQRTADNLDMFNGSPERYEWTLLGRHEMYVPYNSYKLHAKGIPAQTILKPGHINSELTRYELHRVWKVDSKLRDGQRHVFSRRTFYIDEDSWQILAVDHYDRSGNLWRVGEAHPINYYEVPLVWDTLQCFYDLKNGRYLVFGLNNEDDPEDFSAEQNDGNFKPNALRRLGR